MSEDERDVSVDGEEGIISASVSIFSSLLLPPRLLRQSLIDSLNPNKDRASKRTDELLFSWCNGAGTGAAGPQMPE